jgi:hypothetical protein
MTTEKEFENQCSFCGKPLRNEDHEPVDEIVTLVVEVSGYPMNDNLGEWCSLECFKNQILEGIIHKS